MKDTAIKNTGNSRFLRSSVAEDITFSEFIALLRAGKLPIDLAGINPDGIDILGTALTKANLLRDATAAAYGLNGEAVPENVFALLAAFRNATANEHVWSKQSKSQQIVVGDVLITNKEFVWGSTVYYSDSVTITNEAVALVNPQSYTANSGSGATHATTLTPLLHGKYFYVDDNGGSGGSDGECPYDVVLLAGNDFTLTYPGIVFSGLDYYEVSVVNAGDVSYVNSSDPNAYPPAVDDGFTYTNLGKLGDKARIAYGTYTGTGKSGSSNKNTLTFDFEPKIVVVQGLALNGYATYLIMLNGVTNPHVFQHNLHWGLTTAWATKSVSWYSSAETTGYFYQFNASGSTYRYIAIG